MIECKAYSFCFTPQNSSFAFYILAVRAEQELDALEWFCGMI